MTWKNKAERLLGSRTLHLQETDNSPWLRLAEFEHSHCGQRERKQSKP